MRERRANSIKRLVFWRVTRGKALMLFTKNPSGLLMSSHPRELTVAASVHKAMPGDELTAMGLEGQRKMSLRRNSLLLTMMQNNCFTAIYQHPPILQQQCVKKREKTGQERHEPEAGCWNINC